MVRLLPAVCDSVGVLSKKKAISFRNLPFDLEAHLTRREFISCASGAAVAASPLAARSERALKHVVYFTHSAGYRHQVIPLSQQIVQQLGTNSGTFDVTSTEDISVFTSENLARYAAVIFYTSGEFPMSPAQKAALLEFVRLGGGFLGLHSATDTFYTWPDYLDLVGGYFNDHPWHQAVTIEVVEPGNPVVAFLGNSLQLEDEIYQISDFDYQGSRYSCALIKVRWTWASRACVSGFTAGPWRGRGRTARGGYSIRRSATRRPSGETSVISKCSRMPSCGPCGDRPRPR